MQEENQQLQTLEDIKQMMTKSSRFISLSGWSGVAAGMCALIAAWIANQKIAQYQLEKNPDNIIERGTYLSQDGDRYLRNELIILACLTFAAAFLLAFLFTYFRSKKAGVAIWGYTARKLMINVAVPMIAGGLLILRMMDFRFYGLIAPVCLLFYGLALINASKFTLPEIRYVGYFQLLLGILNLWMIGYILFFWAAGFGVLHILYGIVMWNKYERNQ